MKTPPLTPAIKLLDGTIYSNVCHACAYLDMFKEHKELHAQYNGEITQPDFIEGYLKFNGEFVAKALGHSYS